MKAEKLDLYSAWLLFSMFMSMINALNLCSNATESEVCYLKPGYDINLAPNSTLSPTEVEILVYFYDIIEQNDDKRSLTVSMGIETSWKDHRISVKNMSR